jgi:thymidylate synthase (FAD)
VKPYAELLEFNQPNPIRIQGFTRIRDSFPGLESYRPFPDDDGMSFPDPERIMEFAGRWDYGQNNARKLGETTKMRTITLRNPDTDEGYVTSEVPIIQKYLSMGHESMIEMGDATFFIECSRAVNDQIQRHRLASYQQESQRFVKYDELDPEYYDEYLYEPESITSESGMAFGYALRAYKALREQGVSPQEARYVLPMAMRTRIIMKANAREWRHILKLRTHKSVQPEMRELMLQVYDQLIDIWPNALSGVLDGERSVR